MVPGVSIPEGTNGLILTTDAAATTGVAAVVYVGGARGVRLAEKRILSPRDLRARQREHARRPR